MNLDTYFDRNYNQSKYNCAHFVCEVWKYITNQDIENILKGSLCGPKVRKLDAHDLKPLSLLGKPQSPCLALFQSCGKDPHVGIFINGKILHLSENGVNWSCLEILQTQFNKVRYYEIKNDNNS